MSALLRILRSTHGVSMVEYAILLALIALIMIGVISALGSATKNAFQSVSCISTGHGNTNGNGGGNGKGIGGGVGGGKCNGAG